MGKSISNTDPEFTCSHYTVTKTSVLVDNSRIFISSRDTKVNNEKVISIHIIDNLCPHEPCDNYSGICTNSASTLFNGKHSSLIHIRNIIEKKCYLHKASIDIKIGKATTFCSDIKTCRTLCILKSHPIAVIEKGPDAAISDFEINTE